MLSGTEPGLLSAPAFIKVGFLKRSTSALRALNLKLFILPTFLFKQLYWSKQTGKIKWTKK